MRASSVRSTSLLYLVVVSIMVLSHLIFCLVVREWWPVGRSSLYLEEVSRVWSKSRLECPSCSSILLFEDR